MINSYDIDGVIHMGAWGHGVTPAPDDILVTGRSYEEAAKTLRTLRGRGIYNQVFFNPATMEEKDRTRNAEHKAKILTALLVGGMDLRIHFEDDPIAVKIIRDQVPDMKVVFLDHDLCGK